MPLLSKYVGKINGTKLLLTISSIDGGLVNINGVIIIWFIGYDILLGDISIGIASSSTIAMP